VSVSIELSVVVPTYDVRTNVAELVRRLDQVLQGMRWEVVFVDDDSADGTADLVRELARTDARERWLQRLGGRGLSRATGRA
jgi:dolichol-phosphate mannosyltransferase